MNRFLPANRTLVITLFFVLCFFEVRAQLGLRHFIFFSRDRERIHDTAFLNNPGIIGAQVTYTWRNLEPVKGKYDFSAIEEDLRFLQQMNKRLFVQLQDLTFDSRFYAVPDYIIEDSGVVRSTHSGWIPKRWTPAVAERFHLLLTALAKQFDGRLEGINLQETSIDVDTVRHGFSRIAYLNAVKANMLTMRTVFRKSHPVIYANFMVGDSSVEDLAEIYRYALEINCGVGGPDIKVFRPFQMKNSYPLIRAMNRRVITAMAVQEGNYSLDNPKTGKPVTLPDIVDFATNYLQLSHIFWCTEEPYYSRDVLPMLRRK